MQQNLSFEDSEDEDSDDEDSDENRRAQQEDDMQDHPPEAGESELERSPVAASSIPVVPDMRGAVERTDTAAPEDEQTNAPALDVEQTNAAAPDVESKDVDAAAPDVEQRDTAALDIEQANTAAPEVVDSIAPEIETSPVGGRSGSRTAEDSEQQLSPECSVGEPKIRVTSVVAADQTVHTPNGHQTSSALDATSALPKEDRSRRTSGSRRFSFKPDTAWLKAKPESFVMASSPSSAEGPRLTPDTASSTTPAKKGLQPGFKHGTGDSNSLSAAAPPRSAVGVRLTEMEQQLQRDMTAAGYPEAETGTNLNGDDGWLAFEQG